MRFPQLATTGLALAMLAATAAFGQSFERLPYPVAVTNGSATHLSTNGDIAAGDGTKGNNRALRWNAANQVRELVGFNVNSNSFVTSINANGSILGGASENIPSGGGSSNGIRATKWIGDNDAQGLAFFPVFNQFFSNSSVLALSANGDIAVGYCDLYEAVPNTSNPVQGRYLGFFACYWDGTAINLLADLGGRRGSALSMTPNGQFAGGFNELRVNGSNRGDRAVRWNIAGGGRLIVQDLGISAAGQTNSAILALTADGQIMAGNCERWINNNFRGNRAVRWEGELITELPVFPVTVGGNTAGDLLGNDGDDNTVTTFTAMSTDGSIIAGTANKYINSVFIGTRAVRWYVDPVVGEFVAKELGTVNDVTGTSASTGMSADGTIIVGKSTSNQVGGEATLWYEDKPRSLYQLLVRDYGLPLTGWQSLDSIEAISPDGSTVTGLGTFNNLSGVPFRARIGNLDAIINTPPEIIADIPTDPTNSYNAQVGQPLTVTFTANDPDGGPMTIFADGLPAGTQLTPAPGSSGLQSVDPIVLEWVPLADQDGRSFPITLIVQDDAGLEARLRFNLNAGGGGGTPNLPPTLEGTLANGGTLVGRVDQTVSATFTATDPDAAPNAGRLTITATGLPPSATLSPASGSNVTSPTNIALVWTPTEAEAGQTYAVTLAVADVQTARTQITFNLSVAGAGQDLPPTITSNVAQGATLRGGLGQLLTANFTATDPEGGTLAISATGLPLGAELVGGGARTSPADLQIRWTPTTFDLGRAYPVSITAIDSFGQTAARAFILTVSPGKIAPVRNYVPFVDYYVPTAYEWSANAYVESPANAYYYYAYIYSIYAYYYHLYAADLGWTEPQTYQSTLELYFNYRYTQSTYSYYAYYYSQVGLLIDNTNSGYYAWILNYYAYLYGLYDVLAGQ